MRKNLALQVPLLGLSALVVKCVPNLKLFLVRISFFSICFWTTFYSFFDPISLKFMTVFYISIVYLIAELLQNFDLILRASSEIPKNTCIILFKWCAIFLSFLYSGAKALLMYECAKPFDSAVDAQTDSEKKRLLLPSLLFLNRNSFHASEFTSRVSIYFLVSLLGWTIIF